MHSRYAKIRMPRSLTAELLRTLWDDAGVGSWANATEIEGVDFARQAAFHRELEILLALPKDEPPTPKAFRVEAALRVVDGEVQIRLATNSHSAPLLAAALLSIPSVRALLGRCRRCGLFYLSAGAFRRNRFCGPSCRSAARPKARSAEYMRNWRATRKALGRPAR